MAPRRRPIRIADFFWLVAFAAFTLGVVVPAYRFASDANFLVARISNGLLGPLAMLATLSVFVLPCMHLWFGVVMLRSRGSLVTHGIGIAILLNAIPSGFASAAIGRACANQMAG